MTLQPFYIPSPERFSGDAALLLVDQRDQWWRRYGELKGKDYDGLPRELEREELNELTSQPLLNYLVALSFERGEVNFAAEPRLNEIYADLLDAVYERGWGGERHPVTKLIAKDGFVTVLQEIAVTTWEGNGRTATVAEVAERGRKRGFEPLLERFAANAQEGLGRFLTVFYFRYRDERLHGERTFEFTHKTFGEYLTAKWIVSEAKKFAPENPDLLQWVAAFGRIHIDAYLMRFLRNEIALLSQPDRERIAEVAQNVFLVAAMYELPVDQLQPRPGFPDEVPIFEDAGIMALALLSAIGRAEGVPRLLRTLDDPATLRDWLSGLAHTMTVAYRPALHSLSHLTISAADFRHLDLWGADLSRSQFVRARFDNANLTNANLDGCDLQLAAFDGTMARRASFEQRTNLSGASVSEASFVEAAMNEAILDRMECLDTTFSDAHLEKASLAGASLRLCSFAGATLDGADLDGATVTGWVTGATFAGCTFVDADLSRATFADCVFNGAVFRSTKVSDDTFRLVELTEEQRAGLIVVDPEEEAAGEAG